MSVPAWALALAYWIHMIATTLWIGGLAAVSILVAPATQKSLDRVANTPLLADLQRRLDPIGWFCLVTLAGTGMFQMSANPHYQGLLEIQNLWATAILVKHLLFLFMAGSSAYLTWVLLPELRRVGLQQTLTSQGKGLVEKAESLNRRVMHLVRLNLMLGLLVLGLTALARSAA